MLVIECVTSRTTAGGNTQPRWQPTQPCYGHRHSPTNSIPLLMYFELSFLSINDEQTVLHFVLIQALNCSKVTEVLKSHFIFQIFNRLKQ